MKIKSLVVALVILIMCCSLSSVYAVSTINLSGANLSNIDTGDSEISYWPNGNIEYIEIPEGEIWFFENGDVEGFRHDLNGDSSSDIWIDFYEDTHTFEYLDTPSGDISIDENGNMSIDGYANQIIADAQTTLQNFARGVENYFNLINIDINGVQSPKDDLDKLNTTLNNLLSFSNSGASQPVINSGNTNQNTNQNSNNGSVNINVTPNSGNLSVGNTVNVEVNQNGGNLSVGNEVNINADSNGLNMNLPGVNISVGNNIGITQNEKGDPVIDLGELDFNIGKDGISIGVGGAEAQKDSNNIVKYILLGMAFFVAFMILVFGIIIIKKSNNQVVVKDNNQNTPNNQ